MKFGRNKPDITELILLAVIILLPILIFYAIIQTSGPSWDMIVRQLDGRTLLNYLTHKVSLKAAFAGEFSNNNMYYFEPYREPLSTPIFAILGIFFKKPIFAYICITYLVYLFAVYKIGKDLSANKLLVFSLFLNTYLLYFLFIPNGGEGLAVAFVLLGIVYLLRKNPISGLFLGIAVLAKYPAIVLFPLVLLLEDRKKIIKAVLLEIAVLSLWGIIDYVIYGVPFYSLFESITAAGTVSGLSTVYASSLLQVFSYPLAFGAVAIAALLIKKEKIRIRWDHRTKVLAFGIMLAFLGYLVILPHNDPITQARYGFLSSAMLLIAVLVLLGKADNKIFWLKYAIALTAIAILIYGLYSAFLLGNNAGVAYYNIDKNGLYVHAGNVMDSLGFENCRFISNAWVPMIYTGYAAYSPFILYTNKITIPTVSNTLNEYGINYTKSSDNIVPTNYTEYIKEQMGYPILFFKNTGVPGSFIPDLNSSRQVYQDNNFTVYLPENASCFKN
jgi:hypothetical protein